MGKTKSLGRKPLIGVAAILALGTSLGVNAAFDTYMGHARQHKTNAVHRKFEAKHHKMNANFLKIDASRHKRKANQQNHKLKRRKRGY